MREHKIDPCGNPKKTKKIALENAIAILTLSLFYLKLLIYCIGFKYKFSKISTFQLISFKALRKNNSLSM